MFGKKLEQNFYKDLKTIIACKSFKTEEKKGMPFGEGCYNCYLKTIEILENLGFEVIKYDGYGLEISVGGDKNTKPEDEIGIIGHFDVVPVGDGWNTDPFTLTIKDDILYGRGVADDKMPTLLNIYILKELIDSGFKFSKKFRVFIGFNEESGWKDIEYMQKKTTFPTFGFSPDGGFPCTYAEKGAMPAIISIDKPKHFSEIKGGIALNAVCDYVEAKADKEVIDKDLIKELGLTINGDKIISYGVSAHGSAPEKGKNAMKNLFLYMVKKGEYSMELYENLFIDKQKIMQKTNEQGNITFSPNIFSIENDKFVIKCDCRIPAPFTKKDITEKLDKFGVNYTIIELHPPVMTNPKRKEMQIMINSYNSVMGKNEKPILLAGSTFARAFKEGSAFGAGFIEFDACLHKPNENYPIKYMEKAYEIYKTAIMEMAK